MILFLFTVSTRRILEDSVIWIDRLSKEQEEWKEGRLSPIIEKCTLYFSLKLGHNSLCRLLKALVLGSLEFGTYTSHPVYKSSL